MQERRKTQSSSSGEATAYVLKPGRPKRPALPEDIFGVRVNIPLMHQVVVAQQAAARQGTHATKTRGQVSGGGRKPYKQKGTGRARQGSTRAPQFNGGGVVHGPQPRDYSQRTPKKMIAGSLLSALSARAGEERIDVLDFGLNGVPKTKQAVHALSAIADPKKNRFLCVLSRDDAVTWLSLRNVPTAHPLAVDQLNTYDVLHSDYVVFSPDAYQMFVAPEKGLSDIQVMDDLDDETFEGVGDHDDGIEQVPPGERTELRDLNSGVPTEDAADEMVGTGDKTSHRSPLLDRAYQSARQQMGIVTTHQSNDDDETMDGWSVSTDDVEYVAFLRRPGHVLVTWPSKLNAGGAVALFEELAGKAEAVYAKGKANLSYDEPGDVPDWAAIAKVEDLRFLRADIGHGEILIWRVPTEENLHVPRLQIIEPKITGHDLMPLIEDTAEGNVVELIVEHFGTDDFDIEPLNAVG